MRKNKSSHVHLYEEHLADILVFVLKHKMTKATKKNKKNLPSVVGRSRIFVGCLTGTVPTVKDITEDSLLFSFLGSWKCRGVSTALGFSARVGPIRLAQFCQGAMHGDVARAERSGECERSGVVF